MNEPVSKDFDCVKMMREIRHKLSEEIRDMGYDQLREWLRGHRYSDPFLQRLSERIAERAHEANEGRHMNSGN